MTLEDTLKSLNDARIKRDREYDLMIAIINDLMRDALEVEQALESHESKAFQKGRQSAFRFTINHLNRMKARNNG